MIIRVLGTMVGLFFVFVAGLMFISQHVSLIQPITSLIIGFVFIIFGIGGKKALSKILPNTANTNVTK